MKRAAEMSRAASKVLQEDLIRNRASRKKPEKKWQERTETEPAWASDQLRNKKKKRQMLIALERLRLIFSEEGCEWRKQEQLPMYCRW